jgi:hypothetical protein
VGRDCTTRLCCGELPWHDIEAVTPILSSHLISLTRVSDGLNVMPNQFTRRLSCRAASPYLLSSSSPYTHTHILSSRSSKALFAVPHLPHPHSLSTPHIHTPCVLTSSDSCTSHFSTFLSPEYISPNPCHVIPSLGPGSLQERVVGPSSYARNGSQRVTDMSQSPSLLPPSLYFISLLLTFLPPSSFLRPSFCLMNLHSSPPYLPPRIFFFFASLPLSPSNMSGEYCTVGDDGFLRLWSASRRTQTLCLDLKSATRYATLYNLTLTLTLLNLIDGPRSAFLKSPLIT